MSEEEVRGQHRRCLDGVAAQLETAAVGARIRDGLVVVILGPPNAGKSTLFNMLCGRERAIVSPHPGTTRDVLEAELEVGGVRMVLQDTAGLRTGGDEVEIEGHRRAVAAAAEADLAVLLWPADAVGEEPVGPPGVPVIRISSRADLDRRRREGWLRVSCQTGEGVAELRRELVASAAGDIIDLGGRVAIGARHRAYLEQAQRELEAVEWTQPELAAERVREATAALGELVGEVEVETVLDQIFATFCIGK